MSSASVLSNNAAWMSLRLILKFTLCFAIIHSCMNPVPAWALQRAIFSPSIASDCSHAQLSWTKRMFSLINLEVPSLLSQPSMLRAMSTCFALVLLTRHKLEWHHRQMWEQGETTLGFVFNGFAVTLRCTTVQNECPQWEAWNSNHTQHLTRDGCFFSISYSLLITRVLIWQRGQC